MIDKPLDLVGIVEGAGVELRPQGNRHVGLCPFHNEQSPSFTVFPDGHFKCFSCGEYGDAIDFIQRLHVCGFREALKILGIKQGAMTPELAEQIKKRTLQKELMQAFRLWEARAADELSLLVRTGRRVIDRLINTEAGLERYGNTYHWVTLWEYHFDILCNDDDETKLELCRSGVYE